MIQRPSSLFLSITLRLKHSLRLFSLDMQPEERVWYRCLREKASSLESGDDEDGREATGALPGGFFENRCAVAEGPWATSPPGFPSTPLRRSESFGSPTWGDLGVNP